MDLNEISVFIKVVEVGSFRKAAESLGMPNSTVSHKISCLEARLGISLLKRTTRKLNITPEGEAYFKLCQQGLEKIKTAELEILSTQGEPQGTLRITAPNELGSTLLPLLISKYHLKYPKVHIEAVLTERRIDLLSENIDLAIRAGELKDSTLVAKKIGSACFSLFASPQYVKTHGHLNTPHDLKNHRCLQFAPAGINEWILIKNKDFVHVPLKKHLLINDMNAIKNLCVMHEGIAFLPNYLCSNELSSKKLLRLLPDWRSSLSPIHLVYPAQRFVTPKVSAFVNLTSEILKTDFKNFFDEN